MDKYTQNFITHRKVPNLPKNKSLGNLLFAIEFYDNLRKNSLGCVIFLSLKLRIRVAFPQINIPLQHKKNFLKNLKNNLPEIKDQMVKVLLWFCCASLGLFQRQEEFNFNRIVLTVKLNIVYELLVSLR